MTTENAVIKAEARTDITSRNTRKLRREGQLPCVIYGKKGTQTITLPIKSLPATHTTSNVLQIEVGGKKHSVLMREVQTNVLTNLPIHVDFHEVTPEDVVNCKVHVEYVGITKEQEKEAAFRVMLRSVLLRGPMKSLPPKLTINVSHLKAGEAVHTSDVQLPAGVSLRIKGKVALASLTRM